MLRVTLFLGMKSDDVVVVVVAVFGSTHHLKPIETTHISPYLHGYIYIYEYLHDVVYCQAPVYFVAVVVVVKCKYCMSTLMPWPLYMLPSKVFL